MRSRTNFAPTARTIIVALVLMVVGLLGTYGTPPAGPGRRARVRPGAIAILLIGMVVRDDLTDRPERARTGTGCTGPPTRC